MYMFSAQRQHISAFRLLALTTEAWRGAERGAIQKMYMLIYPDPGQAAQTSLNSFPKYYNIFIAD
jgi:hypothetical protein